MTGELQKIFRVAQGNLKVTWEKIAYGQGGGGKGEVTRCIALPNFCDKLLFKALGWGSAAHI
jgi:hypothetical protein